MNLIFLISPKPPLRVCGMAMADVVVCFWSRASPCSLYAQAGLGGNNQWRIGRVAAVAQGKEVPTERRRPKKAAKLKMHRSWTPGRRVSSRRHIADVERGKSRSVESDDPLDEKMQGMVFEDEEESEDETDSEESEDDDEDGDEKQIRVSREDSKRTTHRATKSQLNCQHFSRCSGCTFENQLNSPPVYNEAIPFFQKRRVHDFRLVPSATQGWRCRAKLAVRGTPENPLIGLFEEQSHNIVDIPACRTHHPAINVAVELIKDVIRDVGVQPYDELASSQVGQLRYIQVVVNTYVTSVPAEERYRHARVQVSLVWNARDEDSPGSELLHKMARALWSRGGPKSSEQILHSVWANFQTSQTNIILGQKWRHLFGEKELWERVGGADICYTPSSFGQANYQAFENLLVRLQKYVKKGSVVVDLFAGVGVIGLSLAVTRKCWSVKCVEVNKHSKLPFERSLSRLPKSVNCKISWHCADATEAPITWLEGADVVIVDPPRKGLQPALIDALRTASLRAQGKSRSPSLKETDKTEKRPWVLRAQEEAVQRWGSTSGSTSDEGDGIWPEQLIYVSCGWDAFQEDCEALEYDGCWHLEDAQAFNFFPGTNSIEILAVFKVGKRNKKLEKKKIQPAPRRRKAT